MTKCINCGKAVRLSQTANGSRIVHTSTLQTECDEALIGLAEWEQEFAWKEEQNV